MRQGKEVQLRLGIMMSFFFHMSKYISLFADVVEFLLFV